LQALFTSLNWIDETTECSKPFKGEVWDLFTELSFAGARLSLEPNIDEKPQIDPVAPPAHCSLNQREEDIT